MNLRIIWPLLLVAGCIGGPPSGSDTSPPDVGGDAIADPDLTDSGDGGTDTPDAPDMPEPCVPTTCEELGDICGMAEDGCGGVLECDPCAMPDQIVVNVRSVTLLKGETYPLEAAVLDVDGQTIANATITFSTSDDGVVQTSPSGDLTAVDTGSVTIVLAADGVDPVEVSVSVEDRFRAVAAGQSHTCALTETGRAYCWGNGFSRAVAAPPNQFYPTPQRVHRRDVSLAEIAAGHDHSCAISEDGSKVFCWGSNEWNQVDSDVDVELLPVEVDVTVGPAPYDNLVAGLYHTCVLDADGQPVCWGRNVEGQADYEEPLDVLPPSVVDASAFFDSIAAGAAFTCGIATNGDLVCWGADGNGELGDGTSMETFARTTVNLDDTAIDLDTLSAFDGHACALVDDQRLVCWGYNLSGQVDPNDSASPIHSPSQPFRDEIYLQVATGARHTCAVPAEDNTVLKCWGSNAETSENYDVVGLLGSTVSSDTTFELQFGDSIQQIAAGWFHSCVLLNDGIIRCWGDNDQGQLGNGGMMDSADPVVSGLP